MDTDDARPATPDDVHEICMSLPDVEPGVSWGDRPTYKVPSGGKGRGFLLYRAPHATAVDPTSGEEYTDLLVIHTGTPGDKAALVDDPGTPFFTIPHFDRSNSVLVQRSRLGELTVDELREVITEAWFSRAPRRLHREFAEHHRDEV